MEECILIKKGKKTRFTSGYQPKSNGRPKSNRIELRRLLNELKYEYQDKRITPLIKKMIYDLYSISLSDFDLDGLSSLTTSDKHLYFFKSDMIGGIKIGVSKNVDKRLIQIKEYAKDAELIKYIPYCSEFENNIHKKYKHINIKGNGIGIEWFKSTPDLFLWIQGVNSIDDLANQFGSFSTKKICNQLALFNHK
jgi:hypothetical protein